MGDKAKTKPTLKMGERQDENGYMVPGLGFEFDGTFIANPYTSACGRFDVLNPRSKYGLTLEQIVDICEANDIIPPCQTVTNAIQGKPL